MTAPTTTSTAPPSTFEDVFAQRWTRIVKLAALTIGSVAIAEEIVQDAFEQLHKNWATIEQPTTWLRAAVVNRCRDWLRRRTLERRHAVATDSVVEPDEGIAMRDALKSVTPRQRAAIVLRFYEELSEREIATLLGCRNAGRASDFDADGAHRNSPGVLGGFQASWLHPESPGGSCEVSVEWSAGPPADEG